METQGSDQDPYGPAKASKIRLKTASKSHSGSRKHRHDAKHADGGERRSHKRHRSRDSERRSHGDSKRRHRHGPSRTVADAMHPRHGGYDNPEYRHRESLYDGLDADEGLLPETDGLDPDDAFRESLFDALADDEGASYWEGVYGQPVHVYPNTKPGPDGKLEKMSDEEYAEYVRTKMWEKSHQHIVEEREARERAKRKAEEQRRGLDEDAARQEEEREHIRRRMQESLKRGEERKKAKEAEASWTLYLQKWEELKQRKDLAQAEQKARELIPWPVVSGKWRHVSKEEIEYFFENSTAWKEDPAAMLKIERVRWHPDKMQQRFGQHIDSETMKSVTAVFQVVDRLWNERFRPK